MHSNASLFDRRMLRRRRDRLVRQDLPTSFLRRELVDRLVDRIADLTLPMRHVLELGAQRGELAAALSAAGRSVDLYVALEPSPLMARACASPMTAVVAEEEFLPFHESGFDAVLSAMSLHLANDLPGVLAQASRALRPDGVFASVFPGGQTLMELRDCLTRAELEITGGASARVVPFVGLQDAAALLQRAGFALPIADSERLTVRYRDPIRLLRDLRDLAEPNILYDRQRRPLSRALLVRTLELYRERWGETDGTVPATFDLIHMMGWRAGEDQPRPARRGSAAVSIESVLGDGVGSRDPTRQ